MPPPPQQATLQSAKPGPGSVVGTKFTKVYRGLTEERGKSWIRVHSTIIQSRLLGGFCRVGPLHPVLTASAAKPTLADLDNWNSDATPVIVLPLSILSELTQMHAQTSAYIHTPCCRIREHPCAARIRQPGLLPPGAFRRLYYPSTLRHPLLSLSHPLPFQFFQAGAAVTPDSALSSHIEP